MGKNVEVKGGPEAEDAAEDGMVPDVSPNSPMGRILISRGQLAFARGDEHDVRGKHAGKNDLQSGEGREHETAMVARQKAEDEFLNNVVQKHREDEDRKSMKERKFTVATNVGKAY